MGTAPTTLTLTDRHSLCLYLRWRWQKPRLTVDELPTGLVLAQVLPAWRERYPTPDDRREHLRQVVQSVLNRPSKSHTSGGQE